MGAENKESCSQRDSAEREGYVRACLLYTSYLTSIKTPPSASGMSEVRTSDILLFPPSVSIYYYTKKNNPIQEPYHSWAWILFDRLLFRYPVYCT